MKKPRKSHSEAASKSWHASAANRVLNHDKIEAAGLGIQPHNRRQHEHRADHGEQEKLHRGINLASVAVHADQQRHRDQRRFPEEVEQEQVERGENADQRRLQHQQQDEEFLHPLVNRIPRNQHAQRREERGQHHQPDGNSVNAHVVMNVGSRDPDLVDLELEARRGRDAGAPANAARPQMPARR